MLTSIFLVKPTFKFTFFLFSTMFDSSSCWIYLAIHTSAILYVLFCTWLQLGQEYLNFFQTARIRCWKTTVSMSSNSETVWSHQASHLLLGSGNKKTFLPHIFSDLKSTRNCFIRYISKAYSNLWQSFILDREIGKMHSVFYTEGEGKSYSFYLEVTPLLFRLQKCRLLYFCMLSPQYKWNTWTFFETGDWNMEPAFLASV